VLESLFGHHPHHNNNNNNNNEEVPVVDEVVPEVAVVPLSSPAGLSSTGSSGSGGKRGGLAGELEGLLQMGWYWAGLSKEEAEGLLQGQPDGAFIVRDSSSRNYLLSLSFNR
jgi:hypothetical protein